MSALRRLNSQTIAPFFAILSVVSAPLLAQQQTFTLADLTAQGNILLDQAKAGAGSVSKPLAQWNQHNALLNARTKSGGAELHDRYADILIVLTGEGSEITGGSIIDPKPSAINEIRGTRIEGGETHPLHTGDILHIPAGTPHQAIEAPGQGIVVLVIKIEESSR